MKDFKNYIFESDDTTKNPVKVDAYHGSGRHFTKFDQIHARLANDFYGGGIGYFTDNHHISTKYAKAMSKTTGTPVVYHTHLDMKNVFDVDHKFSGKKLKKLLPKDTKKFAMHSGLLHAGNIEHENSILGNLERGDTELTGHQLFWGLSHGGTKTASARDHLIKHGYDGLRYNGGVNMNQDTKHNVYIPYNSDSIIIKKKEPLK
jgi:hypothetical protein